MIIDCCPQFSVNFITIVTKWEKISSWFQAYALCGKCLCFFSAFLSPPVLCHHWLILLHHIPKQSASHHCSSDLFFFSSFTPVHAPSFWLLQTSPLSCPTIHPTVIFQVPGDTIPLYHYPSQWYCVFKKNKCRENPLALAVHSKTSSA